MPEHSRVVRFYLVGKSDAILTVEGTTEEVMRAFSSKFRFGDGPLAAPLIRQQLVEGRTRGEAHGIKFSVRAPGGVRG